MSQFDIRSFETACSTCSLRELCVPAGLTKSDLEHLSTLVSQRVRLKRGDALIHPGQKFDRLYAVRSGFFKTSLSSPVGGDQIAGFQIPGEVLGLDGVSEGQHSVHVTALEDSEVCVMMYSDIADIASQNCGLQRQLHRVMSREIVREQDVIMLLGSMRAKQRVATFLLNLSDRYETLGYSAAEFVLRMTRKEIGSYLNLKLETVSRTLSQFADENIIKVSGKSVHIVDIEKLRAVLRSAE